MCNILRETCVAIWNALQDLYVRAPSSADDWLTISKDFEQRWNFPHCIGNSTLCFRNNCTITYVGAIDGKHAVIQAHYNAGSNYYFYKGSHSIVLMAICDAQY